VLEERWGKVMRKGKKLFSMSSKALLAYIFMGDVMKNADHFFVHECIGNHSPCFMRFIPHHFVRSAENSYCLLLQKITKINKF
jgi:hypothetical protein